MRATTSRTGTRRGATKKAPKKKVKKATKKKAAARDTGGKGRAAKKKAVAKKTASKKKPTAKKAPKKKATKASRATAAKGRKRSAPKPSPARAPRIPPVPRERWTDEMRDVFTIFEGPEARYLGSKFKAVMTLANHPELASAWLQYNVVLSSKLTLSRRLIEIVILRVAYRLHSEYEWTQHVVIGAGMGLTREHFEAIKQSPDAAIWSELERLCIRAVDQLLTDARIDDELWRKLTLYFDRKHQLEFLFVFGTYSMLARIFNAIGIEPEEMSEEERRQAIFAEDGIYAGLTGK
ncbi:MAG: hypothetical protein OXT09_18900 [Myxococcales bacterium]|nr:hypothetical protein [Myxococcales bacterium]